MTKEKCSHHWTVTSECPRCLRDKLDAEVAKGLALKATKRTLLDQLARQTECKDVWIAKLEQERDAARAGREKALDEGNELRSRAERAEADLGVDLLVELERLRKENEALRYLAKPETQKEIQAQNTALRTELELARDANALCAGKRWDDLEVRVDVLKAELDEARVAYVEAARKRNQAEDQNAALLADVNRAREALGEFQDRDPHHEPLPGRFFHDCPGGCGRCEKATDALAALAKWNKP